MTVTAEPASSEPVSISELEEGVRLAGLVYCSDGLPDITRHTDGDGFRYARPDGSAIDDEDTLARIAALAIPPAYTDVWISADPDGHMQATGRDAKGRKQYRYHARFRELRDGTKFEHIFDFADALPQIRARVASDMRQRNLSREKVLATVVWLLEHTMIRIGNEDYAKQNESYGLTTLHDEHVEVDHDKVEFHFRGKSGKTWNVSVKDKRVAKIVKACQELPGQDLFDYIDKDGKVRDVTSSDVNAYLHEISGKDITAKDFRTWTGTVLAAHALSELEFETASGAKKNIGAAIKHVSQRLGNTPAVCRKSYIHPDVLEAYVAKELALIVAAEADGGGDAGDPQLRLRDDEVAVLGLLRRRVRDKASAAAPPRRKRRVKTAA